MPNDLESAEELHEEMRVELRRLRLDLSTATRLRDDLAAENEALRVDRSEARKAVVRACEEIVQREQENEALREQVAKLERSLAGVLIAARKTLSDIRSIEQAIRAPANALRAMVAAVSEGPDDAP